MKTRSRPGLLLPLAAALVCLIPAAHAAEEPKDDAKKPLEIEAGGAEAAWLARAQAGDWITTRSTVRLDDKTSVVTDARRSVWRVQDEESKDTKDAKDKAKTRVVELKEEAAQGGNTSSTEIQYRVQLVKKTGEAGKRYGGTIASTGWDEDDSKDWVPAAEEQKGLDKRKIAGKTLNCRVYERTVEAGKRKVKIKTWRSDELPFDSVARIEHDGKIVYEVLDFGRGK